MWRDREESQDCLPAGIQEEVPAPSHLFSVVDTYLGQVPVGIGHGHLPPGPCDWTGKVDAIVYDGFGEFEGFYLRTRDGGRHRFYGCEPNVRRLVRQAWEERIMTTVLVDCAHSERPLEIILHAPPQGE